MLVDEALVPLVLAGTSHRETPKVEIIRMVGELTPGVDYDTDTDNRNVHLTEVGAQKMEPGSAASTCTPRSMSRPR